MIFESKNKLKENGGTLNLANNCTSYHNGIPAKLIFRVKPYSIKCLYSKQKMAEY